MQQSVLLLRIWCLIIIYFVSSIILLHSFGWKANAFPVDLSPLGQGLLLLGLIPNTVATAEFVRLPEGSSASGMQQGKSPAETNKGSCGTKTNKDQKMGFPTCAEFPAFTTL